MGLFWQKKLSAGCDWSRPTCCLSSTSEHITHVANLLFEHHGWTFVRIINQDNAVVFGWYRGRRIF